LLNPDPIQAGDESGYNPDLKPVQGFFMTKKYKNFIYFFLIPFKLQRTFRLRRNLQPN
jgi:hypothetical protein